MIEYLNYINSFYILLLTHVTTIISIVLSAVFIFQIKKILSFSYINPIIISIDGNIGSGKSTLIKILKNELSKNKNVIFIPEPVSDWTNNYGTETNILKNFYENKKRWAYTFQNFAFITRSAILNNSIENNKTNIFQKRKVIISERSTETDKFVFAKMLADNDCISKLEYNIYNFWYDKFFNKKINNIVYLRTTPEKSYERIKKRNRNEETNITKSYIQTVHRYHDDWLMKNTKDYNISFIDGNDEFDKNDKNRKNITSKVVKFINSF